MSASSGHPPIRVLIADDSAFMRAALSKMVNSDKDLCVVGTAQNGLEALAKISELQPDVVTLDVDMPGMNGIETLKRVMADSPRPVIIVSALTRKGAATTVEALGLGAFDCVAKQLSYASEDVLKVQAELVGKIKAAAAPKIALARAAGCGSSIGPCDARSSTVGNGTSRHAFSAVKAVAATKTSASAHRSAVSATVPAIIAIGTSTGGPRALQEVLAALPSDLPLAILIVQHMPIGFTEAFAKRLNDLCPLQVHEAQEGAVITAGHVYVAPAGKHLTVQRRSATEVAIHLSLLPSNVPHIPSADIMMSSVAKVFHAATMGIILTGMGSDGALGMQSIYQEGGITVGQDQDSCVVYGMPRCCAEMGVLSDVVPLSQMARHILSALRRPAQNRKLD